MAAVSRVLRWSAQKEAERRIREGLKPNLEGLGLSFEELMAALEESDGGIVGGSALSVFYVGSGWEKVYKRAPRITVVVPFGARETFIGMLGKREWFWRDHPVGRDSRDCVHSVTEATVKRPGYENTSALYPPESIYHETSDPEDAFFDQPEDLDEDDRRRRKKVQWRRKSQAFLKVVESTGHVLQAVWSSPTTRDMIILTPTRLHLLYPRLQHADMGLVGVGRWVRGDNNVVVPDVCRSNSDWPFPCGKMCPIVPKKGLGDEGTGVFYWNQERELAAQEVEKEEVFDPWTGRTGRWSWDSPPRRLPDRNVLEALNEGELFNRSMFKALLANECSNPHCVNYGREAIRFAAEMEESDVTPFDMQGNINCDGHMATLRMAVSGKARNHIAKTTEWIQRRNLHWFHAVLFPQDSETPTIVPVGYRDGSVKHPRDLMVDFYLGPVSPDRPGRRVPMQFVMLGGYPGVATHGFMLRHPENFREANPCFKRMLDQRHVDEMELKGPVLIVLCGPRGFVQASQQDIPYVCAATTWCLAHNYARLITDYAFQQLRIEYEGYGERETDSDRDAESEIGTDLDDDVVETE
ncbi:hypothetical protein CC2G_000224 [Coprinopsis cinerea AmutBmut pab1-1]|nr:hypothetical protein CC2G_000224 [Coprinopsis cinerea AmutBmut pab1-1]